MVQRHEATLRRCSGTVKEPRPGLVPVGAAWQARAMATERALERRVVTVLFADLVGFTSLSEQLDAEDVTLVQDAYFEAVRETVARHGGQLEKFVGDAAMAVFGAPRVRDDDAERAVRAGLALVAAVQRVGAGFGLEPGALRVRVGVASGGTVYGGASAGRGPGPRGA